MIRFFFLLIFLSPSFCISAEFMQSLQSGWEFRQADHAGKWYPARVPGSIYHDLQMAKLIPDPLLYDNESAVQELAKNDWEYRCSFTPAPEQLQMKHALLVFEGLDTYVTIMLNDSVIAVSDNMFLPLKIDIRKHLISGKNTIRLRFHSPLSEAESRQKKSGRKYPGGERTFLRKAAYQSGWDWAPALPGCGIWQGVSIRWWSGFVITDIQVTQDALSDSAGVFRIQLHTLSDVDTTLKLSFSQNNESAMEEKLRILRGASGHDFFLKIRNPKRWWCREMGEPYLYRIQVNIYDTQIRKHILYRGFRTVKIDRDNEDNGRGGFRILLNDKPVYIKGANYIPPSPYPGLITPGTQMKLVEKAAQTGLNMLRVWGGGLYADSVFMSACDRSGILVWHDFMFACAMIPFEGSMVKSIKDEIRYHAVRLSAHPSLALFCGNNEISEGWHNWSWQKEYGLSSSDSTTIWNQYTLLFHITLPSILKSVCSHVPYWESSPMTGWGRPSAYLDGDVHFWGVWWGMQAFENFRTKTGRFVSEYGFQGTPEPYMIRRMTRARSLSFSEPQLKLHQKHPRGFETIDDYARRYFPGPKDFKAQWYVAAIQQAYAMEMAISAHRSKSPFNMGTMFWQWNDCWPAISWSVLDESLRPKAAWYTVKREYEPIHLDLSGRYGDYTFTASVTGNQVCNGLFRYEIVGNTGKVLFSNEKEVTLKPSYSTDLLRLADPLVMKSLDTGLYHVRLYFLQDGKITSQATRLLCRPRYLKLAAPEVNIKVTPLRGSYRLELSSRAFAPWLGITASVPGTYSDNYFHLGPGENRIIMFTPDSPPLSPPVFDLRSLYDVTDHTPAAQH